MRQLDFQTAAMLIGCAAIIALMWAAGGPIAAAIVLACGIALGVAVVTLLK